MMADRDLLEALVRIPSPTGEEAAAVRFMQDQAAADGFRVHRDRAGNFVAEAGRGDRLLLFVGHIDTVPGDIPVRLEDGELWGRGAVDAKGSLAAFYCAARYFVEDDRFRVLVVGAVDEEGRSAGVKALDPSLDPEWIIVGEPSGSTAFTIAYKGILRGAFHVARPAVHGAHADMGAGDQVVAWWADMLKRFDAGTGFDALQFRLETVHTHNDGLSDEATGEFQVRLPPGHAPDDVVAAVREASTHFDVEVTFHERMPAVEADARSPLASAFRAAIRSGGGRAVAKRKTGTADMNHLADWHPGVPIVAYGPGDAALDHRPDERIPLTEFDAGVAVLRDVIGRFAQERP